MLNRLRTYSPDADRMEMILMSTEQMIPIFMIEQEFDVVNDFNFLGSLIKRVEDAKTK